MTTRISLEEYEAAERDLLLAGARKAWRRHAVTFALAVAVAVLIELQSGAVPLLGFFLLGAWAVGLGLHYRGWVRYGEARIRGQQGRVEWRAGRSTQQLVARR